MNEAAMAAVEEKHKTIKNTHFEVALSKVSPSVSDRVRLISLFSYTSNTMPCGEQIS